MNELDRPSTGDEQRIRRDALSVAIGFEGQLPSPPVDDSPWHRPDCTPDVRSACDCPPASFAARQTWARELEDATTDRVFRSAEVFARYIANGVTQQQARGERLDEDLRAVLETSSSSEGR